MTMNTARIQNFTVIAALREVFHHFSYVLLAGIVSFGFFVFAVWLPNLRLIAHTLFQSNIAIGDKISLLLNLMGSIWTNFTVFSAITTIVIAVLFGVNIATIVYFIRKRGAILSGGSFFASIGGVGSGIIGIGCATCGSFVLSAILPVVGAVGVIALFPLKGKEFGILSMSLLLISISAMARKIIEPVVCKPSFSKL